MKPILHFMPVCSVDLYQSLLALISVEVGFVPNYGWASESHLACVMIFLFLSLLQSIWTKLIFFVQKWQPWHHSMTLWACNLFLSFFFSFSRLDVSPKSYVTFVFCFCLKAFPITITEMEDIVTKIVFVLLRKYFSVLMQAREMLSTQY